MTVLHVAVHFILPSLRHFPPSLPQVFSLPPLPPAGVFHTVTPAGEGIGLISMPATLTHRLLFFLSTT